MTAVEDAHMYRAGSVLARRYRLTHRLATGGMGDVWSACDELLGRDVAAKLVKPEYAGNPVFRERLRAEARAAAAVRHPNVVDIYDVGEDAEDGTPVSYVIMELVTGTSLSGLMADGPMAAAEVTDLLVQVGDALAAAHECGVVHRDIKPANLMRDAVGRVTVLDFGIARAADAAALTETGTMLGTARYISPEQVDGCPATTASDVYALGVVAYHCLAGRPPFDAGSDVATAIAHREQDPPPLPATTPAALTSLVMQCMAKRPEARPSAAEVSRRAATLTANPTVGSDGHTLVMPVAAAPAPGETVVVPHQPDAGAGVPSWLEWRKLGAVAAAAVVVLAIIAVLGGLGGGQPSPASAAAKHTATTKTVADRHPSQVHLRPQAYLGEHYRTARRQLKAMGLHPREVGSSSATARVTAIAPIGSVAVGHRIDVTVMAAAAGGHHAHVPAPHHKVKPAPKPPGPKPPGHGHGPGGHGPPGQAKKH